MYICVPHLDDLVRIKVNSYNNIKLTIKCIYSTYLVDVDDKPSDDAPVRNKKEIQPVPEIAADVGESMSDLLFFLGFLFKVCQSLFKTTVF